MPESFTETLENIIDPKTQELERRKYVRAYCLTQALLDKAYAERSKIQLKIDSLSEIQARNVVSLTCYLNRNMSYSFMGVNVSRVNPHCSDKLQSNSFFSLDDVLDFDYYEGDRP